MHNDWMYAHASPLAKLPMYQKTSRRTYSHSAYGHRAHGPSSNVCKAMNCCSGRMASRYSDKLYSVVATTPCTQCRMRGLAYFFSMFWARVVSKQAVASVQNRPRALPVMVFGILVPRCKTSLLFECHLSNGFLGLETDRRVPA